MNTQECCDTPRGFVNGTCDYCGGTVQAETYMIGLDTQTISMNTQIKSPTIFTLHVSELHPLTDTLPKGELSDFDRSKLYYYCSMQSDGKAIAIESPVFSKDDDAEKLRAYSILRELITETITRALLPPTECPQFDFVDGVLTRSNTNQ